MSQKALGWTNHLDDIISDYNSGQLENSQNNSLLMMGNPGSAKNYNLSLFKELAMAGDHGKVIEINASNPPELAELLQFSLPNAFFENQEIKESLQELIERFENGSIDKSTVTVDELELLVDEFDGFNWSEKLDKLKDFESRASNQHIESILRQCRMIAEDVVGKLELNYHNIKENDRIPGSLKKGLEKEGLMTGFNLKAFAPISMGMPTGVEYPSFFEPFAIPVDAYKRHSQLKWGLRVIHGDTNFENYRKLYNNVVDVDDMSFADIKYAKPTKERDYVREISFTGGEPIEVYTSGTSSQRRSQFVEAWDQMFSESGIVCSSGFKHKLRPKLKEALLSDDNDMIILYTGFLNNEGLKKYVMTHFMETFRDIIASLEAEEVENLDYKFIVSILEAQEIVKKDDKDANLDQGDKVFNRFMKEFMNASRHYNTDVWVDSKPDDAHPILKSKTDHQFVTKMNHDDFREIFTGLKTDFRNNAMDAFADSDYTDSDKDNPKSLGHGFIYMNNMNVPTWNGTYGYRIGMKRLSLERPKKLDTISNTNMELFNEYLGLRESGDVMTFDSYLKDLEEEWRETEMEYLEREDQKFEKKKEEEQKQEELEKKRKEKLLKTEVRARAGDGSDLPESWERLVEKAKNSIVEEGLMDNISTDRAMTLTQDIRMELEKKADEKSAEDVDVRPIIDEMLSSEMFVRVRQGEDKKKRYVKKWIRDSEEHDLDDFSEDDIQGIVDDAIGELKLDRFINDSYSLVDEDGWREKYLDEESEEVEAEEDDERSVENEIDDPLSSNNQVDEANDSVSTMDEVKPESKWECDCGAYNGKEDGKIREVCWNCGISYEKSERRKEAGSGQVTF